MITYDVGYGDGTSYACPVMTGMVASLKAAFPNKTNAAIKDAIRQSGHLAMQPDSSLGYGIPNFFMAYLSLLDSSIFINKEGALRATQNTIHKAVHVYVEADKAGALVLELYDLFGNKLYEHKEQLRRQVFNKVSIPNFETYGRGVYALKIQLWGSTYWVELVK